MKEYTTEFQIDSEEYDKNTRIFKKLIVIGITILFFAIAFQFQIIDAVTGNEVRTLSIGSIEVIDSLNPYVGILDISYVYYSLVYNGLQTADQDLKTITDLAISWWYMDGPTAATLQNPTDFSTFDRNSTPEDWPLGSIWEYNLTEHVYWSDGELFDAEDVEYTINVQSGDNFNTFWAYQPSTRWVHHAEVVDDHIVRVFFCEYETKNPYPIAYGNSIGLYIMPEHMFGDREPTYLAFEWDGIPTVGIGPFIGTDNLRNEFIAKEILTLVRNPFYDFIDDSGTRSGLGGVYDQPVEIDRIVFKFYGDENTLQLGMLNGEIDSTIIDPTTFLVWSDESVRSDWLNIVSVLTPTGFCKATAINDYVNAEGDINPLRLDPAVQRAMAIATNKTYIIDQYYKGFGLPGISIISTPVWPDWWWEPGDEISTFSVTDGSGVEIYNYSKPMKDVMEFDLELANEILNVSGYDQWTGGEFGKGARIAGDLVGERMYDLFGAPSSTIVGRTLEFENVAVFEDYMDRQISRYHEVEWKNIGVIAPPHWVNDAEWGALIYSYHFNIQQTYWSGDIDPNYLTYITTSYAMFGWNDFGISEEEYDRLYMNQAKCFNYTERKYWVDECIKWQYLSGSMIVTVYPERCYAYSEKHWTNWGNWTEHPGLTIDMFWSRAPFTYNVKYVESEEREQSSLAMAILVFGSIAAILIATVAIKIRKNREIQRLMDEEDEEMDEEHEKGL